MDTARQLEELGVNLKDLEETFSRSAGPGGQNVNKACGQTSCLVPETFADQVETAVRLRHEPTGLEATRCLVVRRKTFV